MVKLNAKRELFAMDRGHAVYSQILNNGLVGNPVQIS
jgi:hypothetical protein